MAIQYRWEVAVPDGGTEFVSYSQSFTLGSDGKSVTYHILNLRPIQKTTLFHSLHRPLGSMLPELEFFCEVTEVQGDFTHQGQFPSLQPIIESVEIISGFAIATAMRSHETGVLESNRALVAIAS